MVMRGEGKKVGLIIEKSRERVKKRDRTHRSLSSSSARFTNGLIDLRDAGMSIAVECELQDGNFNESQQELLQKNKDRQIC